MMLEDALLHRDIVAFSFSRSRVENGCALGGRYGYITLTDALINDDRNVITVDAVPPHRVFVS